LEEALLADEREHEERIEAARRALGVHFAPVAERVEVAAERARRARSHLVRQLERGTRGADRAVGLEQPVALARPRGDRLLGVELEAREARQSESEEQAGALAVRATQVGREGRPLRRRWHGPGSGAPEARLGERRIVRRRVALRDVDESHARLFLLPEPLERACLPVLGGDAQAARAPLGEPPEPGRGALEVAGQIAYPPRPPAGVG